MFKQPVRNVMSTGIHTIHFNESLDHAVDAFLRNQISILPVVNTTGCCIGVLTFKDLVKLMSERMKRMESKTSASAEETDIQVGDVMSEKYESIHETSSLADTARKILEKKIHHMPVLDDYKTLVGVVSAVDLMALIPEYRLET